VNSRKGAFRLWAVTSIIWSASVGYLAFENLVVPAERVAEYEAQAAYDAHIKKLQDACFEKRKDEPELGNPFDCFDGSHASLPTLSDGYPDDWTPAKQPIKWNWRDFLPYILDSFAFPLGAIAAWFVGLWIVRGFREPQI
jgi:hypothetical protein